MMPSLYTCECHICYVVKECNICQYNHSMCNDCKKKIGKTNCLFCNPCKEKTNKEEFNIRDILRLFFNRFGIFIIIYVSFMIMLTIIGVCVYNFIMWIFGYQNVRFTDDSLSTPKLLIGLAIGMILFTLFLYNI